MTGSACVWKYNFGIADEFAIEMPTVAKILQVELQRGYPCMWVLVDPDAPREQRKFRIIGTGRRHESSLFFKTHIATFQMEQFVWHLFADD